MAQLRTDIWCAAFLRRHNDLGQMCVIARKGDPVAGLVWIEVDHLDGTVTLFGPAPTPYYEGRTEERLFERRLNKVAPADLRERMEREMRFDEDFWLLTLETRGSDYGLDLINANA